MYVHLLQAKDVSRFSKELHIILKKIYYGSLGVLMVIIFLLVLLISLNSIFIHYSCRYTYIWDTTTRRVVSRLGGHNGCVSILLLMQLFI